MSGAIRSKCGKFLLHNRNPRSAELLGLVSVDKGFAGSHAVVDFFNRLRLYLSNRHCLAYVDRPDGSIILTASTQEYNIERFLYSTSDKTACRMLGQVMAQRLLEAGIQQVKWDREDKKYHGKVRLQLSDEALMVFPKRMTHSCEWRHFGLALDSTSIHHSQLEPWLCSVVDHDATQTKEFIDALTVTGVHLGR